MTEATHATLQALLTAIDLFCGAGGATTGMEEARWNGRPICRVQQCINHDPMAIASHRANYPHAVHYIEDITQFDRAKLRRAFILWASLECTNFSNAKGGQSRDPDSRSLDAYMPAYIEQVRPGYFMVENVREFLANGPLVPKVEKVNGRESYCPLHYDKKTGKLGPHLVPESRKAGRDFIRWKQQIEDLGYRCEWKLLNAADFGAETSRVRLFIIFAQEGLPIAWPTPTHSQNGKVPGTLPWKPVKPLLDLSDKGPTIFAPRPSNGKMLKESTLKRLYAGMCLYAAGRKPEEVTRELTSAQWIMTYLSKSAGGAYNPGRTLEAPLATITTQDRLALATATFLTQSYGGTAESKVTPTTQPCRTITTTPNTAAVFIAQYNTGHDEARCKPLDQPLPTIMTRGAGFGLVSPAFLHNPAWGGNNHGLDEPSPTIVAKQDKVPINLVFLSNYNGTGSNVTQAAAPAGTITTTDRLTVVQCQWLLKKFSAEHNHQPLDTPAAALTVRPEMSLITPEPFLDKQYGSGDDNRQRTDVPAGTLTTNPKLGLVQFYVRQQSGSTPTDANQPLPTITTSPGGAMATAVPYLIDNKFDNVGRTLDQPGPTLLTGDHHYLVQQEPFLLRTSFEGAAVPTDEPCPTLLASRRHNCLVQFTQQPEPEPACWQEQPEDTPTMVLLRRFCRHYRIADVFMRLLKVPELLKIQGFAADYELKGTETDQKKFIGNSVVPLIARKLIEAMYAKLQAAMQGPHRRTVLRVLREHGVLEYPHELPLAA